MSVKQPLSLRMRIFHRYLGFFLAGVMAMYAISGIILVFRKTSFLKQSVETVRTVPPNLSAARLGETIKMKDLAFAATEGDVVTLAKERGTYNRATGELTTVKKQYGYVVGKITHLHKATTKDPLYFLNIFFGLGLLFFVISAFWMYMPGGRILRKGLIFTAAGIILTLIMLFV